MNLTLLNQLKQKQIERINTARVSINTGEYIFLKFTIIIVITFGLILAIYFLALCIFSFDQVKETRFYMGVLFLLLFSYSVLLFAVYTILFSENKS